MKNIFFPFKTWEIQVILFLIMLTRASERIFNPMRYTGCYILVEWFSPMLNSHEDICDIEEDNIMID